MLFIDEIHRLRRAVEEILYPAMEDFQLDIVLGKGPTARSIRLDLPRFTLVGATTRTGLDHRSAARPVRRSSPGSTTTRPAISRRSSCARPAILGVRGRAERGAPRSRRRARGTPRIANRLLRRVRDFVEVRGPGGDHRRRSPARAWRCSASTSSGLDKVDRAILDALCVALRRPAGRAVDAGAVSVGEEPETVEDVYEPYLLQQGLLQRTPRGRVATPRAFAHLGEPAPVTELQDASPTLW